MVNAKRNPKTGRASFKEWDLESIDVKVEEIREALVEAAKSGMAEAMTIAMDEHGVDFVLRMNEAKPLTVSCELPFHDNTNPPFFDFDLGQMLRDYVDDGKSFLDSEYKDALVKELRQLADVIEAAAPDDE